MKIFLIHASAGQGHKKAAEALYEEFDARRPGLAIDLRVLDALDHTSFLFGRGYSFLYYMLAKYAPGLWGSLYYLTESIIPRPWTAWVRRLNNSLQARKLERMLVTENPDLVIATHFFPAEVASRLKRQGRISSRVLVVVTDFLVHPYWVNEGADFYVGMMEETREDLMRLGVPGEKIRTLGIPISPRFSRPVDGENLKTKLGLEGGRFTILVTSGSFGSGPLKDMVLAAEALADKVQLIVVCGINKRLGAELVTMKVSFPMCVLGFVNNMHELMAVSDVIVTRSSGLTTCEALARSLPIIIVSRIPGQEAHNADLLLKHQAAFLAANPAAFLTIIGEMILSSECMSGAKKRVEGLARPHAARDIVDFALESERG